MLSNGKSETFLEPPIGSDATDALLEAWREVLRGALDDERTQWERQRQLIEAQSAAIIARLETKVLELQNHVNEQIAARLAQLKDGVDGRDGDQGPAGERGEAGPAGERGERGDWDFRANAVTRDFRVSGAKKVKEATMAKKAKKAKQGHKASAASRALRAIKVSPVKRASKGYQDRMARPAKTAGTARSR